MVETAGPSVNQPIISREPVSFRSASLVRAPANLLKRRSLHSHWTFHPSISSPKSHYHFRLARCLRTRTKEAALVCPHRCTLRRLCARRSLTQLGRPCTGAALSPCPRPAPGNPPPHLGLARCGGAALAHLPPPAIPCLSFPERPQGGPCTQTIALNPTRPAFSVCHVPQSAGSAPRCQLGAGVGVNPRVQPPLPCLPCPRGAPLDLLMVGTPRLSPTEGATALR